MRRQRRFSWEEKIPWHFPGADGAPLQVSFRMLQDLLPSAFAIAVLGAIESLLSAVVADGMAGTKHDPNAELVPLIEATASTAHAYAGDRSGPLGKGGMASKLEAARLATTAGEA